MRLRSGERASGRQICWLSQWWLGALLVVCLAGAAAQARPFVYVANRGSANVSQYAIGAGGGLSPLSPASVPAGSGAFAVAVSPDGRSAYVVGANAIFQYDIGPSSGGLSPKTPPALVTATGPHEIAVSPNGKSAYVTSAFEGILQYDIGPDGALTPKTPPSVPSHFAFGIAVTPDGKSVYVTNQGNTVAQYSVGARGALSPKTPATVAAGDEPVAIAVSPDGKSAYVLDGGHFVLGPVNLTAGVSQFDIDPRTGALSPKTPASISRGSVPTDITVTPDGRNAYTVDLRANSVAQYGIDPLTGRLSPLDPPAVSVPFTPFGESETDPFAIAVSPDGQSAYVTDQFFDEVVQFDIGAGGALSRKTPFTVPTGYDPLGIVATPPPRVPTRKDQCQNGRWHNFRQFRNQGDCVSFVQTGK
jgi:DNA-binding beta-propeller fold protein YncE